VSPPPVTRVTAVGDSVMLGANRAVVDALGPNLLNLNASVSRQFPAAISVVTLLKAAGSLGDEVVVHMGTNGTVSDGQFDDMMRVLAGAKRVVFINAKVPRPWEQQVNDTLAAGVRRYPNTVLIDWHTIGNQHPEYFAADGIHLEASGAQAYAQLILNAL